jgi:hypothetical protein
MNEVQDSRDDLPVVGEAVPFLDGQRLIDGLHMVNEPDSHIAKSGCAMIIAPLCQGRVFLGLVARPSIEFFPDAQGRLDLFVRVGAGIRRRVKGHGHTCGKPRASYDGFSNGARPAATNPRLLALESFYRPILRYRHPSASRASAAQIGGPSGAEGDLFRQDVRDSFALSRAAGFRVSAALRPE